MSERLSAEEKERICELVLDEGKSKSEAARIVGRSVTVVAKVVETYRPDTRLATRLLKASTHTLVERIVAKADVEQAIEVLSRPNIGVLAPALKPGASMGGGIYVSVAADSCGAVNVGIRQELSDGHEATPRELPVPRLPEIEESKGLPEPHHAQGNDVGAQPTGDAAEERPAGLTPKRKNRPKYAVSKEGKRRPVILNYPITPRQETTNG